MVKLVKEMKFGKVYVWLAKDVDGWGVGNSVTGTKYGYTEEEARAMFEVHVEVYKTKALAEAV